MDKSQGDPADLDRAKLEAELGIMIGKAIEDARIMGQIINGQEYDDEQCRARAYLGVFTKLTLLIATKQKHDLSIADRAKYMTMLGVHGSMMVQTMVDGMFVDESAALSVAMLRRLEGNKLTLDHKEIEDIVEGGDAIEVYMDDEQFTLQLKSGGESPTHKLQKIMMVRNEIKA